MNLNVGMIPDDFAAMRQFVELPQGRIAYVEHGHGAAALFIHGVPLNGYHWRHQIAALGDMRRCVCPDLMGLGASDIAPGTPIDFVAQATMLIDLINALAIDQFDLVGNDSGGAIAQIVATRAPGRIRSLTLTNCDTHGNWPPPAFLPILDLAKAGQLGFAFAAFLADSALARSEQGLGLAFEYPDRLTPELVRAYLGPLVASPARMNLLNAYVAAIDVPPGDDLLAALQAFDRPTLIAWGDADVFFGTDCARWLARTIPGTRHCEIVRGAKLFFAEERPDVLNALLREHWTYAADNPALAGKGEIR